MAGDGDAGGDGPGNGWVPAGAWGEEESDRGSGLGGEGVGEDELQFQCGGDGVESGIGTGV